MDFSILFILTLAISMACGKKQTDETSKAGRKGKLFPVFQVVQFNNDACVGSSTRNGTCFTAAECSNKGGKNSGTCASGFGVCCTFDVGCGSSSNQNCTYFVPRTTATAGTCTLEVCPCSDNICQLRLDFMQFVITGPTTLTIPVGGIVYNNLVAKSGAAVTNSGQCLTDTFSVTNPGGGSPPVICGTNTGQHMYVDSSKECNDLVFQLGNTGVGAAIGTRVWNIKVTQYSCDYNNLAPAGCTQYFFGSSGSGNVQSFNYNSGTGQQLANQDQTICVRRERGQCRICWSQTTNSDFSVSGVKTLATGKVIPAKGLNNPSVCCGYGTNGVVMQGFDCVEIPGAMNAAKAIVPSRICGMMLVTISGTASGTVCSTVSPFSIRGVTDQYEYAVEVMKLNKGFTLAYTQDAKNCN